MRVALIGVGLIGGSFAAALRSAGKVSEVVAVDTDPRALAIAQTRGIATEVVADLAAAVRGADLIVIATPVGVTRKVLAAIATELADNAIVTDVGSTKCSVIEDARTALGARFARFVAAHPIAGSEKSGVENADAALFRGKLAVLTPTGESDERAVERVESLWRAVGARTERMAAETHDRVFAAVSHLPHLLAFALVEMIASDPESNLKLNHAGAGFRDFTRIAASSPQMWRDICLANRIPLAEELRRYRARLEALQQRLDVSDGAALEAAFKIAAHTRSATENGTTD
jgi:prephenate dehydrogenase